MKVRRLHTSDFPEHFSEKGGEPCNVARWCRQNLRDTSVEGGTNDCEVMIGGSWLQRQQTTRRCRSRAHSLGDMYKLIIQNLPRKTLKATILETGETVDAEPGLHRSHYPKNDLLRDDKEDRE